MHTRVHASLVSHLLYLSLYTYYCIFDFIISVTLE